VKLVFSSVFMLWHLQQGEIRSAYFFAAYIDDIMRNVSNVSLLNGCYVGLVCVSILLLRG